MQSHTRLLIVVCIIALIVAIVGCYKSTSDLSMPSEPVTAVVVAQSTTTIATTTLATSSVDMRVDIQTPLPNSEVTSPIIVSGKAKGNWFFEANAGLAVLDANKQPITIGNVMATSDWMTTEYVSFTGKITYPASYKGQSGYIQFSNDNPSGLPENSKTFLVPVLFR